MKTVTLGEWGISALLFQKATNVVRHAYGSIFWQFRGGKISSTDST
jgi:hypothetical protein